jgi:hypothetical protein
MVKPSSRWAIEQFIRDMENTIIDGIGGVILRQCIKESPVKIGNPIEEIIVEILRELVFTKIDQLFELGSLDRSVVSSLNTAFASLLHRLIEGLEENVLQNSAVIAVAFKYTRGISISDRQPSSVNRVEKIQKLLWKQLLFF